MLGDSPATARSATPNCRAGSPPAGLRDDLRTLTRLRTQLVKQRAALTNQIKAPGGEIAKKRLKALRDAACEPITAIESAS